MLDGIKSDADRFMLHGLPDRVEVTKLKVSGNSKTATPQEKAFRDLFKDGEKSAYGIVVNSFNELEPEYVKELAKVKDKKVWCIGPVSGSLCNKDNIMDIVERGNKAEINHHECVKWLDAREPASVLYVCFGSLMQISTNQTIEIGLGLESTNRPFIWCIRNKINELEKWFSEQGFEERVKDRGLIVHGWAPQVLILSHCTIGGFLTHCGWNSTLEAISSGVPMVTWPHFGDQFLNEIFIVEVLKIGVRIGVDTPVSFEEDKGQEIVNKDNVKRAIECLMDQGEKGNSRRNIACELAELAKRAMDEGGVFLS
ncbi:UDP-glycosyltransferase 73E1-like protein [Tanacetum coccineum]